MVESVLAASLVHLSELVGVEALYHSLKREGEKQALKEC